MSPRSEQLAWHFLRAVIPVFRAVIPVFKVLRDNMPTLRFREDRRSGSSTRVTDDRLRPGREKTIMATRIDNALRWMMILTGLALAGAASSRAQGPTTPVEIEGRDGRAIDDTGGRHIGRRRCLRAPGVASGDRALSRPLRGRRPPTPLSMAVRNPPSTPSSTDRSRP